MTLVAVPDTGPLIHLAEIDSLDLLSLFDRILVPTTVLDELSVGTVPSGLSELAFQRIEASNDVEYSTDLDPGERAALSVAQERDAVLLTDDMAARDVATDLGVEVHGSIGVIALGYARDRFDKSDAERRMRNLQKKSTLFVSDAVVERGIELLNDD
ncbi:nucleic acid-binding protein [Haloarculaceae archaeon H-GB11]|nr:nucleic acid-binding protein [Haloarculaceae archaeon H-GB11]